MRTRIFMFILAVSSSLCFAQDSDAQDNWRLADAATIRLAPTAFPKLPRKIVRHLQARGCTVPQSYGSSIPHNVISGEFARKGQTDWAVLCSKNRVSAILVFWGGSTKFVAKVAEAEDRGFLQSIDGAGKLGFSRAIGVAEKDHILLNYEEYGGPKPPPIDHQGIEDDFIEKGSTTRYYYRGKWLELQGVD